MEFKRLIPKTRSEFKELFYSSLKSYIATQILHFAVKGLLRGLFGRVVIAATFGMVALNGAVNHDISYKREVIDMMIRHEDLRLKPYNDSLGNLTIGVGRNLNGKGINEKEAIYLLQNDLREAEQFAKKHFCYDKLNDARKIVILSMTFNIGPYGFKKWTNTQRHLCDGNYAAVASGMRSSKWRQQVGKRALELADIMETGRL